jgi:hypothetical protein
MAGLEFHSTEVTDLEDLRTALTKGFGAPPDSSFVDPALLNWKYFERGPDWDGSRSYVLLKDGIIKAHCGVWPMNLEFGDKQISCNSYVDWVSERDTPGAGLILKKKLMAMTEVGIVVGGTEDTRAVVPRIGFKHVSDVTTFARVIRPLQQYIKRPPEQIFKGVARLVRNTSWSVLSRTQSSDQWTAQQVDSFGDWVGQVNESEFPMPRRTASYLNFWLRCPAARVRGFSIHLSGERRGYFLLSQVANQTRIADLRVFSNNVTDWSAAYGLAVSTAAQDKNTSEILAIASTAVAEKSLRNNGFRDRGRDPLFVYDPKGRLAGAKPMFVNLIDGDGAYLFDPAYPFVT